MRTRATLLAGALILAGCFGTEDDGDGLPAATERAGWTVVILNGTEEVQRYHVTSDPRLADEDGDGLADLQEVIKSTDPRRFDTDGDGLLDGPTLRLEPDDPRVATFRSAGIVELPALSFLGEERFSVEAGGRTIDGFTQPLNRDSDRDSLLDGDELRGWTILVGGVSTLVRSDPTFPDSDGDGLRDDLERSLATHPGLADTDGDGTRDGADAAPSCNLRMRLTLDVLELRVSKDVGIQQGADFVALVSTAVAGGDTTETKLGPRRVPTGRTTLNLATPILDIADDGTTIPAVDSLRYVFLVVFTDEDQDVTGTDQEPIRLNGQDNTIQPVVGYTAAAGATVNGTAGQSRTSGDDGSLTYTVTLECV